MLSPPNGLKKEFAQLQKSTYFRFNQHRFIPGPLALLFFCCVIVKSQKLEIHQDLRDKTFKKNRESGRRPRPVSLSDPCRWVYVGIGAHVVGPHVVRLSSIFSHLKDRGRSEKPSRSLTFVSTSPPPRCESGTNLIPAST